METRREVCGGHGVRRVVAAVVWRLLERTRPVGSAVLRAAIRVLVVHRARAVLDVAGHAKLLVDGGIDVPVHLRALQEGHVAVRAHGTVGRDRGPLEPAVVVHEIGIVEHLGAVNAERHPLGDGHGRQRAAAGHAGRRRKKRDLCAIDCIDGRRPQAHTQVGETAQPRAKRVQGRVEVHAEIVRSQPRGRPAHGKPVVDMHSKDRLVAHALLEGQVDVILHLLNGAHRRKTAAGARCGNRTPPGGEGDVADRPRKNHSRAKRKNKRENEHESAGRTTSLHLSSPPFPSIGVSCCRLNTGTTMRSSCRIGNPATAVRPVSRM